MERFALEKLYTFGFFYEIHFGHSIRKIIQSIKLQRSSKEGPLTDTSQLLYCIVPNIGGILGRC